MTINGIYKSQLPVYPKKDEWSSRIYDATNVQVAIIVGDEEHFERACLIAHLINEFYDIEPTHYFPKPECGRGNYDNP